MASTESASDRGKWMALTAALLGWMFDGLEMGLVPLAARPAFKELLGNDPNAPIGLWYAIATAGFLIGAATGGVLFGWLGDRIGRVRAMMLSVLTYALFSGACGFAQSPAQITGLRFLSALGMGGEWSLGVALVMEIWPDRSRAFLAGLIGAAANVGFMLIAVLNLFVVKPYVQESSWRVLFFLGAAPALLTFFIRIFVPESKRWEEEKTKGSTTHWATQDLVGVLVGATGAIGIIYLWAADMSLAVRIIGTIPCMVIVALGYLYPVYRYLNRIEAAERAVVKPRRRSQTLDPYAVGAPNIDEQVEAVETAATSGEADSSGGWAPPDPAHSTRGTLTRMLLGACLGGIALLGSWAAVQQAPNWAGKITGDAADKFQNAGSWTQISLAFGAILGTIGIAFTGTWLSRRITYVLMCLLSLGAVLLFYKGNDGKSDIDAMFLVSALLMGGITATFYGWLPLYLPELFRTRVRATGQGFSFNFGRVLAAIGVLQGGYLIKDVYKEDYATVCSIMSLIYIAGFVVIWFVPETKGKPLPE